MTSTSVHSNAEVSKASISGRDGDSSSATTTSKLRDSCQACALSKVKCHKQKPTCSRCAKRGIVCQYIITKRPGRKRDSTHTNVDSEINGDAMDVARQTSHAVQHSWLGTTNSATANSTFAGSSNFLDPMNLDSTPSGPGNLPNVEQPSSEIISNLWIPLENYTSEHIGTSNDFDELFNSPVNFPDLEAIDNQLFIRGRSDITKLLIPDGIEPEPLSEISSVDVSNTSKTTSPPSHRSPSRSDTAMSIASDPCFCLIQALEIMKKMSSNTIPACVQTINRECATKMFNVCPSMSIVPSTQSVVVENKQTIEVLTTMLQCTCSEDGYLLMVLSMIVFRIVGRYAAVAFRHPDEDFDRSERANMSAPAIEQNRRLTNFDADNEGPKRTAAQLILNELHRVQRLINELSLRLQTHGHESTENGHRRVSVVRHSARESHNPTLSDHLTKAAPFSAARFAQLEVDLRKCLSTLSSEIINMLQQI